VTTCDRCTSPLEHGDLRCAVCALSVRGGAAVAVERAAARILRCTACGAAIAFDPRHQAPACAFCRAVMEVEHPIDPVEQARICLPFEVDRDIASSALRQWLGRRGFFAPATLRDEAVLESLTPIGWAAWIVDANAHVAWTADSDQGSRRSDWAPHSGEAHLRFARIVVPASRGLTDRECEQLAPYYDLGTALPADGTDVPIESFDLQRSAARRAVQEAVEDRARTAILPDIPGTRHRKVSVACMLEGLATDRAALPAWVLAYRFRGRPYRAIVHGQRADIVVGSSPIDWTKVAWIAAIAAAIALAVLLYIAE
jgi:hypothetical protein